MTIKGVSWVRLLFVFLCLLLGFSADMWWSNLSNEAVVAQTNAPVNLVIHPLAGVPATEEPEAEEEVAQKVACLLLWGACRWHSIYRCEMPDNVVEHVDSASDGSAAMSS